MNPAFPPAQPRRGVTLIEVVVSILLISVLMLVSLRASSSINRQNSQNNEMQMADRLITSFFDEVSAVDFQDQQNAVFGLEPGEDPTVRQHYDDIDDFDGRTFAPPTDRNDQLFTPLPGWDYSDWSVSIDVTPAGLDLIGVPRADFETAPLRLVSLECVSPTGQSFSEQWVLSNVPTSSVASSSLNGSSSRATASPGATNAATNSSLSSSPSSGTNQERLRQILVELPGGQNVTITAPLRNRPATVLPVTGGS